MEVAYLRKDAFDWLHRECNVGTIFAIICDVNIFLQTSEIVACSLFAFLLLAYRDTRFVSPLPVDPTVFLDNIVTTYNFPFFCVVNPTL